MLKAVFIFALGFDSSTNAPVVVLKEIYGERTLYISIGFLQDEAIESQMKGIKFSRPMTRDLFKNIMCLLDVNVRELEKEPADKSEKGKDWKDILEDLSPQAFGKYKM